jgi:6-phosphogluconolactonase
MKQTLRVYVGTYTFGSSKGIYTFDLDPGKAHLSQLATTNRIANPSFLALSPDLKYLYAVSEIKEFEGKDQGLVAAFKIKKNGELTFLNQRGTHGVSPCHVTIDDTGKWALISNYRGGNIAVFPIKDSGQLGKATDIIQHHGSSVHPSRQQQAHMHSIFLSPNNRYAYASDLGIDKIMIYQWNRQTGKLEANDPAFFKTRDGAGPRHFAFHPNGLFAYVINELNSTITAFTFDAQTGALTDTGNVSTLPKSFKGENTCADIHVSPSGNTLYGSNRGHDSIVSYKIDKNTGQLELSGHESTRGKTPRNFAIDPSGQLLLAANQNSDNIAIFEIDPKNGLLSFIKDIKVPNPVCIKIALIEP